MAHNLGHTDIANLTAAQIIAAYAPVATPAQITAAQAVKTAPVSPPSPSPTQVAQAAAATKQFTPAQIQQATQVAKTYTAPAVATIPAPTPAPAVAPPALPTLPQPQAPATQDAYIASLAAEQEKARAALEQKYKDEITRIEKQAEESQKRIDEFTALQEGTLEDINRTTQPFREQLENTERQRLYITENFEANQALTRELGTLLTEGNTIIAAEKAKTGLAVIREPRINKTIEDITGRAGVIQATMNARSGQIAEAYRLIDRSVDAITADRKDRLAYYETVFNFYQTARDEEGKKLFALKADEKDFLEAQIFLLKTDLDTATKNAENIKTKMADPDTATTYARAGVSLNDSPEQIAAKLSAYSYTKEVQDNSNKMNLDGYTYLVPGQSAPAGMEVATTTDSKGLTKQWWRKPEVKKAATIDISPSGETIEFSSAQETQLSQAGLSSADGTVKSVFVNTPSAYRQDFIQKGGGTEDTTADELLTDFEEWEAKEGKADIEIGGTADKFLAANYEPGILSTRTGELQSAISETIDQIRKFGIDGISEAQEQEIIVFLQNKEITREEANRILELKEKIK